MCTLNGIQDIALDSPLVKTLRISIQQNTKYDDYIFFMFTHYIKDANICYGYIYLVDKVDDFLEIATRKNNLEYCYEENCFKKETTFMTMEIPTKNAKVDFEFLATENLTSKICLVFDQVSAGRPNP